MKVFEKLQFIPSKDGSIFLNKFNKANNINLDLLNKVNDLNSKIVFYNNRKNQRLLNGNNIIKGNKEYTNEAREITSWFRNRFSLFVNKIESYKIPGFNTELPRTDENITTSTALEAIIENISDIDYFLVRLISKGEFVFSLEKNFLSFLLNYLEIYLILIFYRFNSSSLGYFETLTSPPDDIIANIQEIRMRILNLSKVDLNLPERKTIYSNMRDFYYILRNNKNIFGNDLKTEEEILKTILNILQSYSN